MPWMTIKNEDKGTAARITVGGSGQITAVSARDCRRRLGTPPGAGGALGEIPEVQYPQEWPGAAYRFEARDDGSVQAVLLREESEVAHG